MKAAAWEPPQLEGNRVTAGGGEVIACFEVKYLNVVRGYPCPNLAGRAPTPGEGSGKGEGGGVGAAVTNLGRIAKIYLIQTLPPPSQSSHRYLKRHMCQVDLEPNRHARDSRVCTRPFANTFHHLG